MDVGGVFVTLFGDGSEVFTVHPSPAEAMEQHALGQTIGIAFMKWGSSALNGPRSTEFKQAKDRYDGEASNG